MSQKGLFLFVCIRLERVDLMAQAEQLKQQTLATLSDRDQQLRQLSSMLEEARTHKPKLQQEHYQREVGEKENVFLSSGAAEMFLVRQAANSLSHGVLTGHRGGGQCSWSPTAARPLRQPRLRS